MATGKLSKTSVEAIAPSDNDQYLWDSELSGFGVKVTPKGRRTYLVQYRIGGRRGRTRRYTIGVHGKITVDAAKRKARILFGQVADRIDPRAEEDAKKRAKTVSEVWEGFADDKGNVIGFWPQHVAIKTRPRTQADYQRFWEKKIKPRFGNKPVADLCRSDASQLHAALSKTPRDANHALAVLSIFCNWAETNGFRDGANPCRGIKRYDENKRERYLSRSELQRLSRALRDAETKDGAIYTVALLRLLIFTGARLGEIRNLKWEYVDFERTVIRLPESKTGQKRLFLSPPALDVLSKIPKLEGNPYVIVGLKEGKPLADIYTFWRKVLRETQLKDLRIHDLRHTFASFAVAGGAPLRMIGELLGHTQSVTTERYAHLADDPVRAVNDAVGATLAALMDDEEAEVVQLVS